MSVDAAKKGKTLVSVEDQLQINKFARLHKQFLEAKMELTLINNEVQNLNDALDELLLLDDPDSASIPILIGSIFVHYDQETANGKLEDSKREAELKGKELRNEISLLDKELKGLRAILYAKFGDNIHLETDPET